MTYPFKNFIESIPNIGYLIVIGTSMVIALIGYQFQNEDAIYFSMICHGYATVFFFAKNSYFSLSKFFRFIHLGISVILIGALFKIMHIPNGNAFINIGHVIIFLSYFLYFLSKPIKRALEYFKLAFFATFIYLRVLIIGHFDHEQLFSTITIILSVIIIILMSRDRITNQDWLYD